MLAGLSPVEVEDSGCKKTHLPGGVVFGTDIEQDGAVAGQVLRTAVGVVCGGCGELIDQGAEPGHGGVHGQRIEPEQAYGGGGRADDCFLDGEQCC